MKIKHRQNVYVVLRHDFSGSDVVVASCYSATKADELVGEYTQLFKDKGFKDEEYYFYSTLTTYYDE